jgi:hypothetical protein
MKLGGPDFPVKAVLLPQFPAGFSARESSLQAAKHPIKNPAAPPAELPADTGNAGIPHSESSPLDRNHIPQIAAFKDLALSLGLPHDKLSSFLLSFIPLFSLPLDTKLIQRLRQEVLSLKIPEKANLDRIRSGALAATAAAGKGLTLSTEALEKYAAVIAGEDTDGGGTGHGAGRQDGGSQTNGKRHSEDGPSPEQLRDMVEKIEGRSPLLNILNKIPGKDGRRWINLPFSFSSGGVDFRVSLRLLLFNTNAILWEAECLALDIATESRRWSFTLENAGEGGGTLREIPVFARAVVRIHPPPKQPAALERSLRELLGTAAKEIILKGMTEEGGDHR